MPYAAWRASGRLRLKERSLGCGAVPSRCSFSDRSRYCRMIQKFFHVVADSLVRWTPRGAVHPQNPLNPSDPDEPSSEWPAFE